MGLKQYFLKKLYWHINRALEDDVGSNILQVNYNIPQTANIIDSKIRGGIKIGENVLIEGADIHGFDVEIGDYTTINNSGSTIHSDKASVKIGKFCSIARKVDIQEWNHHSKRLTTSFFPYKFDQMDILDGMQTKGDIIVGNDVWIGAQSVILSGTKIGNGAIIGANSVVSKNIPPYAIAVGSPAKVISYRFEDNIIKKLEEIKWWDWSIEKIKKNSHLFLKDQLEIKDFDKIL